MARLLLFGGKGGVGKTTTSTSTAVGLADAGLKVLLVSSDPAHSTSDSLGVQLNSSPMEVEGAVVDHPKPVEVAPGGPEGAAVPIVAPSGAGGHGDEETR